MQRTGVAEVSTERETNAVPVSFVIALSQLGRSLDMLSFFAKEIHR